MQIYLSGRGIYIELENILKTESLSQWYID